VLLFFIFPFWLLCLMMGIVLCFFRRSRFLAPYLVFCSTGGTVSSFLFFVALVFLSKVAPFDRLTSEWASILLVGGAIFFGGILGLLVGFLAARKSNKWLGWNRSTPGPFATKPEL